MSKRASRRRRRERDRRGRHDLAHTFATFSTVAQAASRAMGDMVDAMPKAIQMMSRFIDSVASRQRLLLGVMGTPFAQSVATALQSNDSLPLLVYADWCDENGRHAAGELARQVGHEMKAQG